MTWQVSEHSENWHIFPLNNIVFANVKNKWSRHFKGKYMKVYSIIEYRFIKKHIQEIQKSIISLEKILYHSLILLQYLVKHILG